MYFIDNCIYRAYPAFFRPKLAYDNIVYSSVAMTNLTKCTKFNSKHTTCSINFLTVLWKKEEKQQLLGCTCQLLHGDIKAL